ncbi:hypothetical protein [Tenuibacillus multivorans]|uniref:Uncharacterized protein n=1 Tax=Tenuibacillus multivorans TaxID=237069 RepID=A0A1G9XRE2_9BACI|nr:hypothetical protein [Tenuibacillus multivorans]GEL75767.1 hypothetical protein TMU01_00020 [Tenuibacillus multivorans]SDM98813.1 hypothetical protein SAMN05216498_1061 [Tenuibacillus multivorans]
MKLYGIILDNDQWVHIIADEISYDEEKITFKKSSFEIAQFNTNNVKKFRDYNMDNEMESEDSE